MRRAPYGARGLKFLLGHTSPENGPSRAPYGARGLKFVFEQLLCDVFESRPVWGAWIEIHCSLSLKSLPMTVAPRMGRVD